MSDQLLKRIAMLLKEQGFGDIATRRSTFSGTLTASQGETKVVVHVTERDELPHRSVALDRTPSAAEIRVKPNFQDIRMGNYGDPLVVIVSRLLESFKSNQREQAEV